MKIKIPNTFMGKPIEGSMERALSEQETPNEAEQEPSKEKYVYVNPGELRLYMDKFNEGIYRGDELLINPITGKPLIFTSKNMKALFMTLIEKGEQGASLEEIAEKAQCRKGSWSNIDTSRKKMNGALNPLGYSIIRSYVENKFYLIKVEEKKK